ncbi:MAG: PfaD family polyunsaturated fatty acid/polyketide biosynthesis protein [Planctomycetota bacterium]
MGGAWRGGTLQHGDEALVAALQAIEGPCYVVADKDAIAVAQDGEATWGANTESGHALLGVVAPCQPQQLGDPTFCSDHGIRYPYVSGAMANGIASVEVVEAMSNAGLLGFFGAAGLPVPVVAAAIDRLQAALGDRPHGFNLIHSPNEPDLEAAVVRLYLDRNVRLVEASAYLDLTLPVVRYRVAGIHEDADGRIVTPNRIVAKVSRIEVATRFFAPPPEKFLATLVAEGAISPEQAKLARRIPMAQDLTAEADSGGHTDNRPALALLPTLIALRDRMQAEYGYALPLRVGAAGGIATPASTAAAFAMGAAYVLTGSVNQGCVEAGTSPQVRQMLADAEQADIAMAPAADMFEMGVEVQVLKRGTMFAMRGHKLYELYRKYDSIDAIPDAERAQLEKTIFRAPLAEIWQQTHAFFAERDPAQNERAARDPKHQMALVFRWYLGQASHWANRGEAARQIDYQIWCGPAMAAFNEWVRGSALEQLENRTVVHVAHNLLYGACVYARAQQLRTQGVPVPNAALCVVPRSAAELSAHGVGGR